MGLASGQARLLSITARLTDNEYRSQRLTNARLNLANLSEEARVEYQEALDNNKFVYVAFNSSGKREKTDLTPTVLWQYQPNKNQYALVNNANKVLVDSVDSKNFRETDNLAEFLKRYDCLDNVSQNVVVPNPTTYHDAPNPKYADWEEQCRAIDEQKEKDRIEYESWVDPNAPIWDEETEKAKYTKHIFDWQIDDSAEAQSFYEMFISAAESCFNNATLHKCDYCYIHVLAHMLDLEINPDGSLPFYYRSYPTSVPSKDINFCSSSWIPGSAINNCGKTPYMWPISNIIANGYDLGDGNGVQTIYTAEHHANASSTDPDKLISDYYLLQHKADPSFVLTEEMILASNYKIDSSGNITHKTLKQKCIDLFYIVEQDYYSHTVNEDVTDYYLNTLVPFIKTFQEDMELTLRGLAIKDFGEDKLDEDAYNAAYEEYLHNLEEYENNLDRPDFDENDPKYDYPTAPPQYIPEPDPTTYHNEIEERLVIIDPEKAQWYTNLWYRMNGMDEPERIYRNSIETTNERAEEITDTEYLLTLFDIKKNTFETCYQEIPSNLATSKNWLNDVLSQGIVTMEKVGVTRTTSDNEFKWSRIIYSNATDIISEEDSNAIAQAEAKYSQIMSDVEKKDKRYQMQIRSLDTEHNALQTEYNSVKSAVDKNIDRSYKVFQG